MAGTLVLLQLNIQVVSHTPKKQLGAHTSKALCGDSVGFGSLGSVMQYLHSGQGKTVSTRATVYTAGPVARLHA